jgi:sortase A
MKSSKSEKIGTGLMLLGLFLICSAAALVFYNVNQSNQAQIQSDEILRQLSVITEEENLADNKDFYVPKSLDADQSVENQPVWKTHPDIEMPTVDIDGRAYIGTLSIPALDLELPIMSEWSYPSLQISPCRYYGSVYKNNMVIAAHNYESHFGLIKTLSIGDAVTFTDVDNNVFNYTVSDVTQLGPYDSDIMTTGDWDLTLFTCTIGGSYRVTVRCTLVE